MIRKLAGPPVPIILTPNENLNHYAGYSAQSFVSNGVLTLNFTVLLSPSLTWTDDSVSICTLPEEVRPRTAMTLLRNVFIMTASGEVFVRSCTVGADGRVVVDINGPIEGVSRVGFFGANVNVSRWGVGI